MPKRQQKSRWSADVTEHSDALDLEPKVFEKKSAGDIAKSLKRSAETSDRRKSSPFPVSNVDVDLLHEFEPGETFLPSGSTPSKRRKENCATCLDAVA